MVKRGARKDKGQADAARAKNASAPAKPKEAVRKQAPPQPQQRAQPPPPPSKKGGKKGKKRRIPRTAAVIITCPEGQYKEFLRLAMDQVDPASLGIEGMTTRRATGAQVFEVEGPNHHEKADALAKCVSEALAGREGVRVSHPLPHSGAANQGSL